MHSSLPQKERLAQLKRHGQVSLSVFATKSLVLSAVFIAVLALAKQIAKLAQQPASFTLSDLLRIVVITALTTICAGVIATLAQTRMALGWSLLKAKKSPGLEPLRAVFWLVMAALLAVGFIRLVGSDLLLIARSEPGAPLANSIDLTLSRVCKLVVVAGSVLAIIVGAVARLGFLIKHRQVKRASDD